MVTPSAVRGAHEPVTAPAVREFDHRDSGTPESSWVAAAELTTAPQMTLAGVARLVVVAAHPDDESLGAAGILATAAAAGIDIVVLIATLGEGSHPESTTHSAQQLKTLRRAEVFAALGAVAPTAAVRLLSLPDGRLTDHRGVLAAAIRQSIAPAVNPSTHLSIDPGMTLVVAPWRGDGHPDHEAAGAAAALAADETGARLLEYPIWAWHWGSPADLPAELVRLDLGPAGRRAKEAALQCHRSQVEPLSQLPGDEAVVSPAFAEHFRRPYEIFVTAAEPARSTSLPQGFFDDFYADGEDPWGFESRWYEKRKRALTMASLPRERFARAFEPGCSIGVLTAELALRCDELLATDISARPLAAARARLAANDGVRFEQRRIPQEWPVGEFDLVVLSEVGYYCSAADLRVLVERAAASLSPQGALVACHWRHRVADYPLRGDDVHRALRAAPSLGLLAEHREEDFLLDVYLRAPVVSVARAAGLA